MRKAFVGAVMVIVLGLAGSASAFPISVMVGDNDGYGIGVPDNGSTSWSCCFDARSAAEAAASNGAQITDVYSSIFPGFGPNPSNVAHVLFPIDSLTLTSASLTIDMGDFESSTYGPIAATVNGVVLPFAFDDGFRNTVVRTFTLNAAMLAAANAAHIVDLRLEHTPDFGDFIAFDYFQLNAEAVPEPASLVLLGTGLLGGIRAMRKRTR